MDRTEKNNSIIEIKITGISGKFITFRPLPACDDNIDLLMSDVLAKRIKPLDRTPSPLGSTSPLSLEQVRKEYVRFMMFSGVLGDKFTCDDIKLRATKKHLL